MVGVIGDRGPINSPSPVRQGRITMSTEVDKRTYQEFSERAKRLGKSKSAYLRQLVEELIDKYDRPL